jgi:glycosyltransferase involved in cell wall biosynthesis
LIKKILFQAGCVHVTSDFEMAICKELGVMSPIALIPNGVDIDDLQKMSPVSNKTYWQKRIQGHAYVLFLGRISQEKGVDLLIEAWHTVFRRFPDVLLVIAGPAFNRFGKRIIDKVSRSHTRDSIIFTGNVDGQFKAALLRNAEMLVLPSYSESFGNVVLEAMAFNIPIVASEGTPWKSIESIGCGFWVPAKCEAISQAIIKMLSTSKQERALIGKKGHGFAKRCFQWDVVAKMYLKIYQQVMIR